MKLFYIRSIVLLYVLQGVLGSAVMADTLKTQIPFSAIKIAIGSDHSLIVEKDSTLWVSGSNEYGQLGLGDTIRNINRFRKVMTGVSDVAAGSTHSLVLKNDGSLWAAGQNYWGEFGTGDTASSRIFVKIMKDVMGMAAGYHCSMVIKRDSTLWATGKNDDLWLGTGSKGDIKKFKKVLSGVCTVSMGESHTLALKGDGTLWGAGGNWRYQIGWKDQVDSNNHRIHLNGTASFLQLLTGVTAIAAGETHSLALKKDGTLWAAGWNEYGQLGTGDNDYREEFTMVLSKVVAIAAGNRFSFALRTDGILWVTGGNGYGDYPKYAIYDNKKRTMFRRSLTDVAAMTTSFGYGANCYLVLKKDGTVWGMGNDGWGALGRGIYPELKEWVQIFHP